MLTSYPSKTHRKIFKASYTTTPICDSAGQPILHRTTHHIIYLPHISSDTLRKTINMGLFTSLFNIVSCRNPLSSNNADHCSHREACKTSERHKKPEDKTDPDTPPNEFQIACEVYARKLVGELREPRRCRQSRDGYYSKEWTRATNERDYAAMTRKERDIRKLRKAARKAGYSL